MIPFALFSLHLRKFLFGMFWKTDEKILNRQILNSVEEIIFPFKKCWLNFFFWCIYVCMYILVFMYYVYISFLGYREENYDTFFKNSEQWK